jgi:hypothetical protein
MNTIVNLRVYLITKYVKIKLTITSMIIIRPYL